MINEKLLSEVLGIEATESTLEKRNMVEYLDWSNNGCGSAINTHELAFDKCVEGIFKQGYDARMFRAMNIYHVRLWGKGVVDRRFYSNPDDKYDAVFQACEWILKQIEKSNKASKIKETLS